MEKNGMKMRFREDDKREMKTFFENVLNDMRESQLKLYADLLELNREKAYKQVYGLIEDLKTQYETTLKKEVLRDFQKWQDGQSSIQAFIKDIGAGNSNDEIMVEVRKFEEQLKEVLIEISSKELEVPVLTTIVNMNISMDAVVDKIADLYKREMTELETLMASTDRSVKERREENYIYNPIGILLNTILLTNKNFFEKMRNGTKKEFRDMLFSESKKTIKNEEDEKKQLKAFAQEVVDTLKSDSDIFKKILF